MWPNDSYGAFLDHWVNFLGIFKFGFIEAAIHNGNTRLPHVHLVLGYISVRSISWLCNDVMFSVSFKWPSLETSFLYLRMISN